MTEKEFGTLPEGKVFRRLCIPNVLSNLFAALYVMVDGVFVGQFRMRWRLSTSSGRFCP